MVNCLPAKHHHVVFIIQLRALLCFSAASQSRWHGSVLFRVLLASSRGVDSGQSLLEISEVCVSKHTLTRISSADLSASHYICSTRSTFTLKTFLSFSFFLRSWQTQWTCQSVAFTNFDPQAQLLFRVFKNSILLYFTQGSPAVFSGHGPLSWWRYSILLWIFMGPLSPLIRSC